MARVHNWDFMAVALSAARLALPLAAAMALALASAGGAVAGAIVGQQVEKSLTKKLAQEITIEMDDGSTVVVVQEAKEPPFNTGDRVSVLESRGGYARVRHEDYTISQY